jgi:glycosyltransferase 2 family protein
MASSLKQTQKIILFFIVGAMILGLVFALFSDGRQLLQVVHHLEILPLFLALLCMGGAYLFLGLSFSVIFKMAHHHIPFWRLFTITFISATFNYIVSSGGMSTMGVRSFLLKHEKVPYPVSIPMSFAQNMIFNLVLSFVCLGGVIYLRNHRELTGDAFQVVVLLCMLGLIAIVTLMILVFFNRRFRHWFLRHLLNLINWTTHRLFGKKKSNLKKQKELLDEIEISVKYLHEGWTRLLLVLLWVTLDWFFTALTLYFCFRAAGIHLSFGLLLVGFAVEFLTSTANVVPAGLGVTEGSLAGVFKLFGVDFNQTLVAALLFRVIFFFIPLAVSTVLYLDTMRTLWKKEVEHKKASPQDLPADLSS